jgi:hypothetical protein
MSFGVVDGVLLFISRDDGDDDLIVVFCLLGA